MPQFFPDGPAAVNLNAIQEAGGINIPAEPTSDFDTPGMQGTMQQLLSENLGKYVMADFLIGVSNIVRRVGVLYSVGRGFLVLYEENSHTFDVCDIFSLKFVAFFPPGFEPSFEDVLSGAYPSGILPIFDSTSFSRDNGLPGYVNPMSRNNTSMGMGGGSAQSGGMNNNTNMMNGGMTNTRPSSGNGCRTLGQR